MKTIPLPLRTIFALSLAMSTVPARAAAQAIAPPAPADLGERITLADTWSLPGTLGGGFKSSDEYTDGNLFLVAPVHSTLGQGGTLGGSVVFLEPYSSWGEEGEVAASLGIGLRHLFNTQGVKALTEPDGHQAGFLEEGVFAGVNLFGDMLNTQHDRTFWQLGFGAEIGTRYLEARGNYYLPLTDRQLAEEIRGLETYTTSSSSQRVTPINSPYATGNTIAQDALYSTAVTTTTTTIERLFRLYEEGMEGWDVEMALLVPWLDRYADLKIVGGYYSFDNRPFGPQNGGTGDVEGWKAGIEFRPVPAAVVTATWYEDERYIGSDWMVGLRMEIPFEMGNLGDGKTFWGRIKDAFRPRRRHLAERLAEPVHRQNAAVKLGHSTEQKERVASVKTKTRVVSQGARHLVLVNDVAFVNDGAAVGNGIGAGGPTGDGSAARPLDAIQAGADLAQANSNATGRIWNVYTQGTGTGYTGNIAINVGSVNFIGSGTRIPGVGGTSFGSGPAPLVHGAFLANNIGFFGMNGYELNGMLYSYGGITLQDVRRASIVGNSITGVSGSGISVTTNGTTASSAWIARNTIGGTAAYGILLFPDADSSIAADIVGNRITSTLSPALGGFPDLNARLRVRAVDNVAELAGGSGFHLAALNASTIDFFGARNRIDGVKGNAMELVAWENGTVNATIVRSAIANANYGINAVVTNNGRLNLNVWDSAITNSGGYGAYLQSQDAATLTATFGRDLFDGAGWDYIGTLSMGTSTLSLSVFSNLFASAVNHSLNLAAQGTSTQNFVATSNTIRDQGGTGIFVQASNPGATFHVAICSNVLRDNSGSGLWFQANGTSRIDGVIAGNSIANTTSDAILIEGRDSSVIDLQLTANAISGSQFGNGIFASAITDANATVGFSGNSVTGTPGDGIRLATTNAATLNVPRFDANFVAGYGNNGMDILRLDATSALGVFGTQNNLVGPATMGQRVSFGSTTPTVGFPVNGLFLASPTDVP